MTETDGAVEASSIPMPLSGDYSLYFHIPFCTRKCDYCHFYVVPNEDRFKKIYREALKKEWGLRKPLIDAQKQHLQSIYFGGGTPTLLNPGDIEEILTWILPPPSCEITLEANPENLSLEKMREFRESGINRVSVGVQALDDALLQALSRSHSAEQAQKSVELIARAGIENISIDLMYDLPGQTLKSWEHTLDNALSLPLTHLSLYNLTIEPHTVFYKKRGSLPLPDSETSFQMLTTAIEKLENAGFTRYEISAFAKSNQYSRHNTGYWRGRPFLGFGPSAFSYWQGSRFRNRAHLHRYAKSLDAGEDPADFRETLPPHEHLKESLAIGLRLLEGIALQSLPQEIEWRVQNLISEGFLEKTADRLRLTPRGLLFHDTVAEEIMGVDLNRL